MAKIVDVTDVPEMPGAGMLHFDDGRPPLMALPEIADEHRERLGMSAMQGVAGPGDSSNPDEFRRAYAQASGPPPAAHAPQDSLPPQFQAQGPFYATKPFGAPPQASGGAPPAPPQVPGAPEPSGDPKYSETDALVDDANAVARQRAAEDLIYGKQTAGSAGRPGGYQPSGQVVKTERGPAYDPQMAGDRLDAGDAVLQAQMTQARSQQEQAQAMASHAAAKNLAAQQQVRNQQAEMARRQQLFQQQEQGLQKELADYSDSAKPEPRRFFDSPAGFFSGFLSVIGQGLGAFGASLNHTQNYAFDAAQNQMKMEMAAQEKAYDGGRGDRKNALARLVAHYDGDMDKARLGLSQALNKVAETETLAFGAQSRSKDIGANAQVLAAQFRQQQLLDEQKRVELAAGKSTIESTDKYQTAQGASGPGRKPLTDAETAARLKVIKQSDGLAAKDQVKTEVAYGEKKRDLLAARQAVEEEAKAYGLQYNRETGEITGHDGKPVDAEKLSIPGVGRLHMPSSGLLSSEGARAARRARMKSTSAYRKAVTGVAFSPQEAAEAEESTHGETEVDALRTLQERASNLSEVDRAVDAEHPPEIVEGYRRRSAQTNVERSNRGAAAPKVTRYAPGADDTDSEDDAR